MRFVPWFGKLAFAAQSFSFLANTATRISKESVVYTRDREAVWYLQRRGFRCVLNAHNWPYKKRLAAWLVSHAKGVLCNSKGTQTAVQEAVQLPTAVAYNATDQNSFAGHDKAMLREALGLPIGKKIALYSGHLYGWKGTEVLLQCARLCESQTELLFVIIGGTPEDVATAQKKASSMANIIFLGHQPKILVPQFLVCADVLLLPNTNATAESVRFTSPLKMFEYMASGTPLVASDLPSIREILTEKIAFFAEAGNAASLAEAVRLVLAHPQEAAEKAQTALAQSAQYSWEAHAKQVAAFIESVAA
jgi:glycosyltransferase involved in cell wall biosynthesis